MPFDHWRVLLAGQGLDPSPMVKKNRFCMVCGTFAGNSAVTKLRNFLVKFARKPVPITAGRVGFMTVLFAWEAWFWHSGILAIVELSKVPSPVK